MAMIGARIWERRKNIQDWVGAQTPDVVALQEFMFSYSFGKC